jgi:hypothetical protein
LEALANTIDSRGWAVKNVNVNLFSQPSYVSAYAGNSDRLVDPSTLPQEVPNYDTQAVNDIMDTQTSPTAQHFDQLITATEQQRRQQAVAKMQQAAQPSTSTQPADYWFMNQTPQPTEPGTAAFDTPAVVTPGSDQPTPVPVAPPQVSAADEQKLLDKIHKKRKQPDPMNSHLKRIKPLAEQHDEAKKKASETASAPVTPPSKPAILELANNDDLNISTIARQANKANKQGPPDDEVVISLR